MKKHLGLKACVLLFVMFFHSFVLVPKSYALGTVVDMAAARTAFRAVAPSVVKAAKTTGGIGFLIGVAVQGGLLYLALKPGAVTRLADWWDSTLAPHQFDQYESYSYSNWHAHILRFNEAGTDVRIYQGSGSDSNDLTGHGPPGPTWNCGRYQTYYLFGSYAAAMDFLNNNPNPTPAYPGNNSPPTTPTDYLTSIGATFNGFNAGDIFMTPGGAASLTGSEPIISAVQMPSADLDKAIAGMQMTNPSPSTGVQPDPGPTPNDNTVTSGDSSIIGLLKGIYTYVSNLVDIKSDTGSIKTGIDCVVSGVSSMTSATNQSLGKLDNIAIASQAMKNTMDNVGIAINNQTAAINQIPPKLDNVVQSVESLKNTTASQSSLSSRVGEVKNLLLTKFPFSIVGAVTSPGAVTGGTYSIPDLQFPMGTSVSVDPMANTEIHSWVTWLRGLMAVGMWAIFVLVMVRRVTEI